jgi:HEAT repeat protein
LRLEAVRVLGEMGRAARAAVPALREALPDTHPEVRLRVAEVLRAIEPK